MKKILRQWARCTDNLEKMKSDHEILEELASKKWFQDAVAAERRALCH